MIFDAKNLSIVQTKRLNEISYEIRSQYIDLIDDFYPLNLSNDNWIFTALASKDSFLTDIYFQICMTILIWEEINFGKKIQKIIVYNTGTYSVLNKLFLKHDKNIQLVNASKSVNTNKKRIKTIIYMFLTTIVNYFFVRKMPQRKFEQITLLDTFILENSFKDGIYNDRYYTKIFKYLNEENADRMFYLSTYSAKLGKKIQQMKQAHQNDKFIIMEDYLEFNDYLKSILNVIWPGKINFPSLKISQIDFFDLFKYEFKCSRINSTSFQAYLNFYFIKRFIRAGNSIVKFIDWNENQIIDKAITKSIRNESPSTQILAYRGYIVSDQFIWMYPSKQEKKAGVLPDIYAVVGVNLIDSVKEFCPDIKVISSPAFRFNELYSKRTNFPENEFTILVALPIDFKHSLILLNTLIAFKNKLPKNYVYLVKPHPTYSSDLIRLHIDKADSYFLFNEDSFNSCLEKSNLLISSMSSAAMESLAKGIPCIIKCNSSEFYRIPIPRTIPELIWKLCLTEEEMFDAIKYFATMDKNLIEKESFKIRETYFTKVTKDNVSDFFHLDRTFNYRG